MEIFSEAERLFENSSGNRDLVSAIVLAGSVLGIVEPLLRERHVKPTHDVFVEIEKLNSASDEKPLKHGAFKAVYNSLKHAGNSSWHLKAWEDLEVYADLHEEAEWLLDAARQDLRSLTRLLGQR